METQVTPNTQEPTTTASAPAEPKEEKKTKEKSKPMKTSANTEISLKDIVIPKDIEWNRDSTRNSSELVASLKEVGQLVALIVRKNGDKYDLIDGRRRYMAMKEAGIHTAFVTFTEGDNNEVKRAAIVANLNRKEHDPIELCTIFNDLVENGYSNREIARGCGVSDGFVSQHMALKNLSSPLQTAVRKGNLSVTQARELLRIDQEKYAEGFEKLAQKALDGMDAAQLKDAVTLYLEKKKTQEKEKEDKREAKEGASGKKKATKKEEVKKGRPIKTKEYDSKAINMINKSALLAMLETVEGQRARSESVLRQRYLQGMRDGLEIAGGLRDAD